ncbi:MAG: DUF418 domain-containing transporter [Deltaproteobacteria bacterium]|nr:DUF418 domain-containing transporter [Deltaproteobacteria bacterium]MBK8714038.1 DUF418 domain-containing transporter [Deltaproteobacteria bacterium]MBP7285708.1 DUF418 domain-containing transporter [Nannocystaceae bacterium]
MAGSARMCGLDALRGIAVFLMIEQHVGVWLWQGIARGRPLGSAWPLVAFNALGGGAAPMFITLAGVGTALLARARREGVDAVLVRRGLVLLGLGYLLSWMTPSWFSWGSWFVLHLMGFAMATAPLWRRLGDRALLGTAIVVAIAAIAVQGWLDMPFQVDNPYMRNTGRPGGALRLALAESQFPILPWLAPFLVGMVAGRWIAERRFRAIATMGAVSLAIGAIGLGIGLSWSEPEWVHRAFAVHLGFFPASITIVALLLGLVLLVIAAVSAWDERAPLSERNPMVVLGRASLTLLLVHVPLFREATRPLHYWQALPAGVVLLVIAAFLLLSTVLARQWQRVGYRGGAEWLLRRLGG